MTINDHPEDRAPTADDVERALESFWRGSPAAFDRLVAEGDDDADGVCSKLAKIGGVAGDHPPRPNRIGDYAILREIGHGGMAVVYAAKQERTGRTVALKVIRRWTPAGESRFKYFRREVEALARLKHPNIATLYDAGQTEDGHHYFAMELAAGESLSGFIARSPAGGSIKAVDIRGRLEMFRNICEAMNYAHQRGIIHCDLKPSNIFVDSEGKSKVLDFGLARLLDPDGTVTTTLMDSGKIIGTLAYMCPEQARGQIDRIDIRSDVYSLGVVLYELLTGKLPYPSRGVSLTEAIRSVCEEPPRKPHSFNASLRGDLETIILKALEKEPERRYQSAAALAEDVDRYLSNRPIVARSPSAAYHLRKFVARHKVTTALTAALALTAMGSAVVFVSQAAQVVKERDRARVEARRAERINEYLRGILTSLDPREIGKQVSLYDVLNIATMGIDTELADQPETRAWLHDTLGRGYLTLKRYKEAKRELEAAMNLKREIYGDRHPLYASSLHQYGNTLYGPEAQEKKRWYLDRAYKIRREALGESHIDIAESLAALARWEEWVGNFDKAEKMYRECISMRRKILGEHRSVALAMHSFAEMLVRIGKYEEALPILEQTLEMRRRLLGNDHFDVARALTDLGEIHLRWANFDQAEDCHREQIRILRGIFGEHGNVELALALADLAGILHIQNKFTEAELLHRESVEMELRNRKPVDRAEYTWNNYGVFLIAQGRPIEAEPYCRKVYTGWGGKADRPTPARGYASQNLGLVLFELGQFDESEKLFRDAIESWRTLFGKEHPKLARGLIGLGRIEQLKGHYTEAEELYREAVEIRRARLGERNPLTAVSEVYLAGILHEQGKPGGEAMIRKAIKLLREELGDRHAHVSWALCRLGEMLQDQGEFDGAKASYREAVAIERGLDRDKHPVLAACLTGLAEIHSKRGEAQEAESLLTEALDIRTTRFVEDDRRIALSKSALGECTAAQGSYAEAEPLLLGSYKTIASAYGRKHRRAQRARERIVRLYEAWGRPDKADAYRSMRPNAAADAEPVDAP